MDTKLKNSKRNYLLSIVTFLILVMTSIGIINIYPRIENIAQDNLSSLYESYQFLGSLSKTNYVLYKEIEEKREEKELLPVQLFLKSYPGNESDYNYAKDRVNNEISNWERTLKKDLKNLDYLAVVNNDEISVTNTTEDLSLLLSSNDGERSKIKDIYAFYVVLNFDKAGNMTINNIYGADFTKVADILVDRNLNQLIGFDSRVTTNSVENMSVVYAVPKELKYTDNINYYIDSVLVDGVIEASVVFIVIAIAIIILFTLIISIRKWKDAIVIKSFIKIPFEILTILITLCIAMPIAGSGWIILGTLNGTFIDNLISTGLSAKSLEVAVYAVNFLWWLVLGFGTLLGIVLIKYIFSVGISKYIKEKTLVFKFFRLVNRFALKLYKYVSDIDLRDKSNKSIFKILGVNFVILSIMCSIWFFGIGISVAYTIVLFFILTKYSDDIKRKYSILLKATNKIAEGNLDVTIEEDLGVFEPFKGELEKIQSGFKKAVEEEVKSQKMKTDLISNVSHDLKTPLTSIITYVDLLKDENITEEDRRSYIDTIDRKSQRLKNLIEDLFEVSKATSKNVQLNIIDVDIVSLMKQTQFELSDKIQESSLNFRWNFPEEKVILPLDSQKTFRVFENLLMNIVKYSMPNSRVYVDIINEEDMVEISLKNMSAEEISFNPNEIVERFVRGDKSRNTDGSGLGLAIAKSFVELQGGKFDVETDGDLFKVKIIFNK